MTVSWTPYSTVRPLMAGLPSWVPEPEQERIGAYDVFEQIYWGHPTVFKLQQRGSDAQPIYIPSARTIVDTTARYVAKGLGYTVADSLDPTVTPNEKDRSAAQFAFQVLFRREKFLSNFHANKLYGIMKGDYVFHVLADPERVEGKRISIQGVPPGAYFPIYTDPKDPGTLQGVLLADLVDIGGKTFVRRQAYRQELQDDGNKAIFSSLGYFKPEADAWYNLEGEPEDVEGTIPEFPLDPDIQSIPVYHIRHNPTPNAPYGNSEIRGLERLFAAVNQGISDEELALALEGLGMYATEGGPPMDDDGNVLPSWPLGPGRVVETDPNANFRRVAGISSVTPYMDHLQFLVSAAREATGANDAATGKVDVQVAESGIALALRLEPLLSRVDYMDLEVVDVNNNLFFDLTTMWFPVYESQNFLSITVESTLGNKLPTNRKEMFAELVQLHMLGAITTTFLLQEAEKLGYKFPDGAEAMATAALAEQATRTVNSDPFAARAGADTGAQEAQTGVGA